MIHAAVITGGHSFELLPFHRFFRSLSGVDAVIQHMDDFASASEVERDSYDVVVFFSMLLPTPVDEGLPWYQGKPLGALQRLTQTGQGVVLVHHALLAYREWPFWDELVGISSRSFDYFPGQDVPVEIVDSQHAITRGLAPFTLRDETYLMPSAGADSHVLLATAHPRSIATLAWTRTVGRAKVFCFQPGHDHLAWEHPAYAELLTRGMAWSAGKLV